MKNQRVQKVLKQIAQKHGGILQPEIVVEEARPKNHPLHSRFEWDDTEASHQWRLQQARMLIRVCVEVTSSDAEPTPVFVSLSTDRGLEAGGYRVTTEVMSDRELREQLMKDALFELNRFQRKYSHLRQLAEVFSAIKRVKKAA